jgi:hypothetical protein
MTAATLLTADGFLHMTAATLLTADGFLHMTAATLLTANVTAAAAVAVFSVCQRLAPSATAAACCGVCSKRRPLHAGM